MSAAAKISLAAAAESNRADFLLENIVRDVQASALQIGAVAGIIAAASQTDASGLKSCRHLLYDDSKVSSLVLRYGAEGGLKPETVKALETMFAAIGAAKREVAAALGKTASQQRDSASALAGAWRRLAGVALKSLDLLEGPTRARLAQVYAQDAQTLKTFLKDAADGKSRALDEGGVLHAPALRQRRQSARLNVETPCTVVSDSGAYPARLADVSRTGLGLTCAGPLAIGDSVVVKLETGRELIGSVARRSDRSIGLTLAQPLPSNDPLFQA